jgi:kinesin family protein 5
LYYSREQIFDHIEQENNNNLYEIKFSILEIYKEKLRDLLNPSIKFSDLKIKENPKTGIFVDNLTSIAVEEREEVYAILEQAEENRNVAETKLNQLSSRSHIVFMLSLQQKLQDNSEKVGVLNLVDLAGSEKVSFPLNPGI